MELLFLSNILHIYIYAWTNTKRWNRFYQWSVHYRDMVDSDSSRIHYGVRRKSYIWSLISACGVMSGISSRHILCRQTEYRSAISPDHRLCRFAKISGHPAISRITVYFGLPKYHGIYLLSTGISQRFIGVTDYHNSSIIRAYQNIIASISRCVESKNI